MFQTIKQLPEMLGPSWILSWTGPIRNPLGEIYTSGHQTWLGGKPIIDGNSRIRKWIYFRPYFVIFSEI